MVPRMCVYIMYLGLLLGEAFNKYSTKSNTDQI